jgi:uncharacterized delta-60 repeat protein
MIVGGNFLTRRLLADGGNDSTFAASAFNQQPYSSIAQSDGRIVIVGTFTTYGGVTTNRIVRLNTNGTRDTTFNIGTGFNAFAKIIIQTSSGLLYVVGPFGTYNGTTRNGIALLNSNGTLDTFFNPGGGTTAAEAIALQSDGKIIIGGSFTSYAGTSINRIARINTNGTIDNTFSVGTGFNGTVWSLAVMSNGQIIVGGSFSTYNGITRNRIARLNSNGTLDTSWDPGTGYNSTVLSLLPAKIIGPPPTPSITATPAPSGGTGGALIPQTAALQQSSSSNICNINFRRSVFVVTYSSAEIQAALSRTSFTITGISFTVTTQPLYQPLPNYSIGMKLTQNSITTNNSGTTGGTFTVVKQPGNESFTSNTTKTFTFTTPFAWTSGNNLVISFAWGQVQPTWNASGQNPIGDGTSFFSWTDNAGFYTVNDAAGTSVAYRPVIRLLGS